ncbi:MAG TPA: glycine oxidase ThiO [Candidatus Sulfotelmatobacter sp.]
MKTWDVIIVGGGVIGLSLAIELRKRSATVLVIERGEPGREASHAAGGMLVDCGLETPTALQPLATASARMYPEFAYEVEVESGMKVDLRDQGTIVLLSPEDAERYTEFLSANRLPSPLKELEPALARIDSSAVFLPLFLEERSVDPRALSAAAWEAAKRRGVDFSTGDAVQSIIFSAGADRALVRARTEYHGKKVVNCAGAWSGELGPHPFPTRPVKGQMLCLAMPSRTLLKHVIRAPDVYLIPRSDGRLLVGATVEEAGFDKRTDPDTIQRLHKAAIALVPQLIEARFLDAWGGLRPGTPDALPILGETATPGYYVATGHFRDGILLAPITAEIMADVIEGKTPEFDLAPFSPARF